MSDTPRYLLGNGERLTERIEAPPGGGATRDPYSLAEARRRLEPQLKEAVDVLDDLPDGASPGGSVVGVVTMHPQRLAKSYHPKQILDDYGLNQVGSRPTEIVPDQWTRKGEPQESIASELFVAGTVDSFAAWHRDLEENVPDVSAQIRNVENVRAPTAVERLRDIDRSDRSTLLEVALHNPTGSQVIVPGFEAYVESLEGEAHLDHRIDVGGLCFVPVSLDPGRELELAQFAFVRVARRMPRMRALPGMIRSTPRNIPVSAGLPDTDALNEDIKVAIFDGGLRENTPVSRWANSVDPSLIGDDVEEFLAHGHDVTSAILFGSLTPGVAPEAPYATVDHIRILDSNSNDNPFELYDEIQRIKEILDKNIYEFINFSIGPDLPVEDDEVHPWTAILDEYLTGGDVLASIAVGNNGSPGPPDSERRVQVPGDVVNGLCVGAANSQGANWDRASYSAIGPGRSPGLVKPEVVGFGGEGQEPFYVIDRSNPMAVGITQGTSFASPAVLRTAVGLRAFFGDSLSALSLRAILVHSAERSEASKREVGWGRVHSTVEPITVCEPGTVRVVYQGEIEPAHYVRALLPVPPTGVDGMVTIDATFAYCCPTDPQDPGTYTTSGLDIVYRPHEDKFEDDSSTLAKTRSFFRKSPFDNEKELRSRAQKWDTTRHASVRCRGSSLKRPVFDIHHNARTQGGNALGASPLKYALVVTVRAPRNQSLYEDTVRAYAGRLRVLQPVVEIPTRSQISTMDR